jgi:dynein heavy chain
VARLKVFNMYKKWKSFRIWKRFVRSRKTRHHRTELGKTLFILNQTFQSSLCGVSEQCFALSGIKLLSFMPNTTYTLDQFCTVQGSHRSNVEQQLTAFCYRSMESVRGACQEAMVQLEERLFGKTARIEDGQIGTSKKNHEDDSHKFTYAITAAKRSEQRRLLSYIRMVDYMICDTLRLLLVDSISVLLAALKHIPGAAAHAQAAPFEAQVQEEAKGKDGGISSESDNDDHFMDDNAFTDREAAAHKEADAKPKRPAPVFAVEIVMQGDELVFSPSSVEVQQKIEAVVGRLVELISLVNRLLTYEGLQAFVQVHTLTHTKYTHIHTTAHEHTQTHTNLPNTQPVSHHKWRTRWYWFETVPLSCTPHAHRAVQLP